MLTVVGQPTDKFVFVLQTSVMMIVISAVHDLHQKTNRLLVYIRFEVCLCSLSKHALLNAKLDLINGKPNW